jgi:DnaJ-class molecular chaperone
VLQREIDSGRTEAFAQIREAELKVMPNEPCRLCDGTGTRKRGLPATPTPDGVKCHKCDGTGSARPDDAMYPFSVENVQQFANFLRDSGGFGIY